MSSHDTVVVQKSGLVINPKYPYIGASPDRVVSCMCCGDGLLEIKCPFKYRDKSPTDEEALNDKNYCLVRNNHGVIHLSPTHAYYDQVQGQMVVAQRNFCDFVCWTEVGIFVERVYLDNDYEKEKFRHLQSFFRKFLLPELLTHRLHDSLLPSSESTSTTGNTVVSITVTSHPTTTHTHTATTSITSHPTTTRTHMATTSITSHPTTTRTHTATTSITSHPTALRTRTNTHPTTSDTSRSKRLHDEIETSDDMYCICKQDRSGRMIACDSPTCKIEWFHYQCVNIKRAPKGAWFCPDCK